MVDVGRVAHPRVSMNDGTPEGQTAAGQRQREADTTFFTQVQNALNGVVRNTQNHDKTLAQWRDYLNNFHENHKVSYESLVDRVRALETQVGVVEGTQKLQAEVDQKLGAQVDAGVAEVERVKAIVEAKVDRIDGVFITEMDGMKATYKNEVEAMKSIIEQKVEDITAELVK